MFLLYAMRDHNIILCILPTGKKTQAKKQRGKDWENICFYISKYEELFGEKYWFEMKKSSFHVLDSLNNRKPQPWHMDSNCGVLFWKRKDKREHLSVAVNLENNLKTAYFWHSFYMTESCLKVILSPMTLC